MARGARRGFTLIELLVALLVIFALMGLILGGIKHIGKYAKSTADNANAKALQQGVHQFSQTFGFLPPLVKDGFDAYFSTGPLPTTGPKRPLVYSLGVPEERSFLRFATNSATPPPPAVGSVDLRFSLHSLPYYVIGVLDEPRNGAVDPTPIDGIAGPGFRAPKRDGTFEKGGKTFSPFFDVSKNAKALFDTQPGTGRIVLTDSHGVGYRYYRWEKGREYAPPAGNYEVRTNDDLNVPWMVGDSANLDPQTKSASYAIVAAGPNGVFGDEFLLPPTHPQYLDRNAFDAKLGGKAPPPNAAGDPERIDRGKADNIVIVGTEK